MTEQNNDENLANIQMNLNSNWWNYIVPANVQRDIRREYDIASFPV